MTNEEREKLIDDIDTVLYNHLDVGHSCRERESIAREIVAIAQTAFEKQIEEAYTEGFSRANEMIIRRAHDHEAQSEWYSSRSFAAILASIPEK